MYPSAPTVSLTIIGIVVVNSILLRDELEDFASAVAFEAIGVAAALTVGGNIAVGPDFGEGVCVFFAKVGGGDGVKSL